MFATESTESLLSPDGVALLASAGVGEGLLDWLQEPDGIDRWRETWSEWRPASDADRDAALLIEASVRHELISTLSVITDETDQRIAITLWCIHARSVWGLLNLQSGYKSSAGDWNLATLHGLSALSSTVGAVEALLPPPFRSLLQDVWMQATVQAAFPDRENALPKPGDPPALSLADEPWKEGVERDTLRTRLRELQELLTARDRERSLLAAEVGTNIVADATEVARQKLRQLNTRLAEQAREIAQLRMERDEIAGHLPGREPASDAAEKIRSLTQSLRQLEGRLALREADRRAFEKELGTSNAEDILMHIQSLQSKESKLRNRVSLLQTNGLFLLRELGGEELGGEEPNNDAWFWQATEQARALKNAVAERNAQVSELRAQWESVAIEAGASDPATVAARIRSLQAQLRRVQSEISEMMSGSDGFVLEEPVALPPMPLFGARRK